MNKLENDLFLAEIQQHDVICLAETQFGNDQKNCCGRVSLLYCFVDLSPKIIDTLVGWRF